MALVIYNNLEAAPKYEKIIGGWVGLSSVPTIAVKSP